MDISPEARRPLRVDYRISVDSPSNALPWSAQTNNPTTERKVEGIRESETMRVRRAWSTIGNGDGGEILDQTLTDLGQSYTQGDEVVWEPPSELDQEYVDYLSASVDQLNRLIEAGIVEVAEDGNIRPVSQSIENEQPSSEV